MKYLLWIPVVVLSFFACEYSVPRHPIITSAAEIMEENPDSAYRLLSSVSEPETLSATDKADYYLQLTLAQYKLDMDFDSDSLIAFSAAYYAGQGKKASNNTGLAYYLQGYVNEMQGKKEKAMINYKDALHHFSFTEQARWQALAHQNIALLYGNESFHEQAIDAYKQAAVLFETLSETFGLACCYYNIGEMNNLMGREDSAKHYFKITKSLSNKMENMQLYNRAVAELGKILSQTNPHKAKPLLKQAYEYDNREHLQTLPFLAYIYAKEQQSDSARYYLNIIQEKKPTNSNELLITLVQSYLYEEEGNYHEAFKLMEKAYKLNDSIEKEIRESRVFEIEKRYDLSQKEMQLAQIQLEKNKQKTYNWILSLGLAVSVLGSLLLLLLFYNLQKRKHFRIKYEKQIVEHRLREERMQNEQKKELLLTKLKVKAENTIEFNNIKMGLSEEEKLSDFIEKISIQSIISKAEQKEYIEEINELYSGRLHQLRIQYPNVTDSDLILLALICVGCDITSCGTLLSMNKNTLYTRRKRIKSHIGIPANTDIEDWIKDNITNIYPNNCEKHLMQNLNLG